MWNQYRCFRAAVFTVVAVGAAACGPSSSQYRDQLVRYDRAVPDPKVIDDGDDLFAGKDVLEVDELIAAVLARNPSIDYARAGWQAALARYPQATTLEDPMVSYSVAPLSIFSSDARFGQTIEVSQPLPYPGKRGLRGQVALAEAEAARQDYAAVQLRLAHMAALLYYDLYAIERAIAFFTEFESELNMHREVIAAQLNELVHRRPELPLPAPPSTLAAPAPATESSAQLQAIALRERPELRAAGARRDRETASIEVADRDFYPDFRVMGTYTSMFAMIEHQIMIGFAVTLPVWRGRRHGAVDEATARRDRASAELEVVEDRIRTEVERAYQALTAALAVLGTYRDDILPSARSRVEAIRLAVDSGRQTFIEVLRADHDLLAANLQYERALATAHRRSADLETAVGRLGATDVDGGAR